MCQNERTSISSDHQFQKKNLYVIIIMVFKFVFIARYFNIFSLNLSIRSHRRWEKNLFNFINIIYIIYYTHLYNILFSSPYEPDVLYYYTTAYLFTIRLKYIIFLCKTFKLILFGTIIFLFCVSNKLYF